MPLTRISLGSTHQVAGVSGAEVARADAWQAGTLLPRLGGRPTVWSPRPIGFVKETIDAGFAPTWFDGRRRDRLR